MMLFCELGAIQHVKILTEAKDGKQKKMWSAALDKDKSTPQPPEEASKPQGDAAPLSTFGRTEKKKSFISALGGNMGSNSVVPRCLVRGERKVSVQI